MGRQEWNVKREQPDVPEIAFDGESIRLCNSGKEVWQVPLSEVRAIGEYTNENGPMWDDWYLVFVGREGNWYEVPADAPTVQPMLVLLSERLHAPLGLTLLRSTSLASAILWPPRLRGGEFLSFNRVSRGSWLSRLLGSRRVEYALTKPVIDALNAS